MPVTLAASEKDNFLASLATEPFGTQQNWYVAHTHIHAESKAAFHLQRQGFGIYLPRYLKKRRHARRVDTVAAPLFPRYVFVSVDMATQRWHSIRSTTGISRLVSDGDIPAIVPPAIIDGLKRREDTSGFVKLENRPRFLLGDQIQVRDGAFANALGLFESNTGEDRVAILLDLLGRKVRVVLDADFIEAAYGTRAEGNSCSSRRYGVA